MCCVRNDTVLGELIAPEGDASPKELHLVSEKKRKRSNNVTSHLRDGSHLEHVDRIGSTKWSTIYEKETPAHFEIRSERQMKLRILQDK